MRMRFSGQDGDGDGDGRIGWCGTSTYWFRLTLIFGGGLLRLLVWLDSCKVGGGRIREKGGEEKGGEKR